MTATRPWLRAVSQGALLAVVLFGASAAPVSAQGPTAEPRPPALFTETAPTDGGALVASLTDAELRRLVIEHLRTTRAAEPPAAPAAHGGGGFALLLLSYRLALEEFIATVRAWGAQLAEGVRLAPMELSDAVHRVTAGANAPTLVTALLAILLAGTVVRSLVRRRFAGDLLGSEPTVALGPRLGRASYRALGELLALGAFVFVALGLSAVVAPDHGPARTFLLTYITAAAVALAASGLSRLLLAPDAPAARLVPIADGTARLLHRWFVALTTVAVTAWLTAALLILSGVPLAVHLILVLAIGALVAGMAVAFILRVRQPVAANLLDGCDPAEAEGLRGRLARNWHAYAVLYIAIIWCLWAASILERRPSAVWAAIGSVALVAALPALDRLVGAMLGRVCGEEGQGQRGSYAGAIRHGFRIALVVAALILLPHLWGLDLLRPLGAPGAGALWGALFDLTATLLVAYIVWLLAEAALERSFGAQQPQEAADAAAVQPSARVRTLKPLVRKFILAVLVAMSVMIALSAIGVNIGPLLAGAGVVGIALGFGAQTLVRDIVSGIFFLIDDAFRVGEYVAAGSLRGTVEQISLRSLRLRHHRGPVHTIPFGELRSLTNHSRDWVIVKLELLVVYGTDIDQVKPIIKRIGKEMLQDPELGPKLIEPLKSQGIYQFADHGIVVRAKFVAKPGEQFVIRREAYKRIKVAFEANGIQFAYPTVTIHTTAAAGADGTSLADGAALPDATATAAAARAIRAALAAKA